MNKKINFNNILYKVSNNINLSKPEAEYSFKKIISGQLSDIQIAGFLMALATKGVTVAEILEASKILRKRRLRPFPFPQTL